MTTNNLTLKLPDFDGPLDLLVTLIKDNKLDIEQLDIDILASQYLDYINQHKDEIMIDEAGEYLLMASNLIYLKSKKLLKFDNAMNVIDTNLIDYEREKLIRQILEYKKYKDALPVLNKKFDIRQTMFSKKQYDLEKLFDIPIEKIEKLPNKLNSNALYKAMQAAYENWKMNLYANHEIIVQELSIEDVENQIIEIFRKHRHLQKISLSDFMLLIDPLYITDQYFVTCFVSLLDLVKNEKIKLFQESFDSEIFIEILM